MSTKQEKHIDNKFNKVIRLAREDDLPQLCSLYWEFHHFHVEGVADRLRMPRNAKDEKEESQRLEQGLRSIMQREDAAIFVAEVDHTIVGFAEVYLHQDEEAPLRIAHRYGHLQSLLVSAPYRKRGLGEALMQAVQQWAREQGATEMQLEAWEFDAGPVPFYKRLNYRTLRHVMVTDIHKPSELS